MIDPEKLSQLHDKDYREEYVAHLVRSGIAAQIRALRSQSGLTQREFARVTGKTQSVVSRLENTEYGRVSVQTLLDIAGAMDVALVVKFVSHDDFFDHMGPAMLRPDRLRVATFQEVADNYRQHDDDATNISPGLRAELASTSTQTEYQIVSLEEYRERRDRDRVEYSTADRFGYSRAGQPSFRGHVA